MPLGTLQTPITIDQTELSERVSEVLTKFARLVSWKVIQETYTGAAEVRGRPSVLRSVDALAYQ